MYSFLGRLVVSKLALFVGLVLGVATAAVVESGGFGYDFATMAGLAVGVGVALWSVYHIWKRE